MVGVIYGAGVAAESDIVSWVGRLGQSAGSVSWVGQLGWSAGSVNKVMFGNPGGKLNRHCQGFDPGRILAGLALGGWVSEMR
jgi:hypothetical protein